MKGYTKPNFTQTPNLFLDDHVKEMKEAELRVALAIMRQTFGWHRGSHRMSIAFLANATGMSKRGVRNGIRDGIARGVIKRAKDRDSWMYWLVVSEGDQVVSEGDQNKGAGKLSSPHPGVNEGDPHPPDQGVNEGDPNKEMSLKKGEPSEKNNNNNKEKPAQPAAAAPSSFDQGLFDLLKANSFEEPTRTRLASMGIKAETFKAWWEYATGEDNIINPVGFTTRMLIDGLPAPAPRPKEYDYTEDYTILE